MTNVIGDDDNVNEKKAKSMMNNGDSKMERMFQTNNEISTQNSNATSTQVIINDLKGENNMLKGQLDQ